MQGLFIHDYSGGFLYGDPPRDKDLTPRETVPVAERLDQIMGAHNQSLDSARPVFERQVGTCRDYALMLCSMLRHHGTAARVRCGFARYFGFNDFDDHWLVEYWRHDESRWAMADAQLDAAHRKHYDISFPIHDVPTGQFVSASAAWKMIRVGSFDASQFGHGDDDGEWFMHVNLIRDVLAMQNNEVSPWDQWRDVDGDNRVLDDSIRTLCDEMAHMAMRPQTRAYITKPAWL